MEHKVEKLSTNLGSCPRALGPDYNAPTAWGSIGELGLKLDQVAADNEAANHPMRAALELGKAVGNVKRSVSVQVDRQTQALDGRLSKIKNFAIQSSKKFNARIDSELNGWGAAKGSNENLVGTPDWATEAMKAFERRLDNMSSRVAKETADTDEQTIWFAGLGFWAAKKSHAWVAIHMPEHPCGLVVDIHTVMEHVYTALAPNELIN